ncbi:hypothetical protein E2562_030741 [Oryza meyeriana var. granulata]|uniref:Uncharacterized protein n=1 Tax=Oryza meyeriana var. granulata TaxID=110450 RepID=A0A6G1E4H4_9ORYZ|nr:hypothetical protein E2562_030741 [Oryza meyeriana var. granulata]
MAARRVLLRATALGLAAAAGGSLHCVATWKPPESIPSFDPTMRHLLLGSVPALQSALLRAHPLSGEHLHDVRARAEHDLARVDAVGPEGDAAAATDLRLFLALLAARDGRAEEALRLYAEAARDSPFDTRPRALAYYVCLLTDREEEGKHWNAAYRSLVPESEIIDPNFPGYFESKEMIDLIDELAVAASLGGVCSLEHPPVRIFVAPSALRKVDADLSAEQDKTLSTAERLHLRALRVYLHAMVRRLAGEDIKLVLEQHNHDGGNR